jgi:hypothetical protein
MAFGTVRPLVLLMKSRCFDWMPRKEQVLNYVTARKIASGIIAVVLLVALLAVKPHRVDAATLTVTNLNDDGAGSLRATVAIAASGDTINIVPAGTILLTSGHILIDKNLTINGAGRALSFINGNNVSHVFKVQANTLFTLSNVTLEQGPVRNFGLTAPNTGGAIHNAGTLTIFDSALNNNVAISGGGALYNAGTATLTNVMLNKNALYNRYCSYGGAILNDTGATLDVIESTFSENVPSSLNNCGRSGALHNRGIARIQQSLFYKNITDLGGAISSEGANASLSVINSTIYQNTRAFGLATGGGGIEVTSGTLTIVHSTIANNYTATTSAELATSGGGLYIHAGSTVTVANSIFAGNGDRIHNNGTIIPGDIRGAFGSGGYNIVQTRLNSSGYISSDFPDGTNPLLNPLADNGGKTQTVSLQSGSPAIDAIPAVGGCNGAGVAVDQRGLPRPFNVLCDTGAFESGATPSTATATATRIPSPTPSNTSTPLPPTNDTIGVYKDGTFYLRNLNTNGGLANLIVNFGGNPSDLPVVGDWNGDGVDSIGVYRGSIGVFYLSNSNPAPAAVYTPVFGNPGDQPLSGKWTPDMTGDGIGVYRNSNGVLYERKTLDTGIADFFAIFGNPGDQPIAGDWDANTYSSVGIYRPTNSTWYLTNNSTPSGITFGDISFVWDIGNNPPVAGDWDADGISTVGYFNVSIGVFTLHSSNSSAGTDNVFGFGPLNGKPIAGKWGISGPPPTPGSILSSAPGEDTPVDSGSGD